MRYLLAVVVLNISVLLVNGGDGDCSLGCWTDNADRAIAGGIRLNSNNPVEDCRNYAREQGFSVFAVQYFTQCFTAADAAETYNKYGESSGCVNGRGGGWAQNVYQVACQGNILTSDMEVNQPDVGWNGVPERAIDGNTDGSYSQNSCTHSGRHYQNKWSVKMDDAYAISKVRIYNRLDCCQERINEVKVFAGPVYCGEIAYEANKHFYDVDCGGAVAKRITIVNSYNWLTLCEVQAFGELSSGLW
ncbi:hypothetical protein ACHWQZ_G015267 [Mnemiopsis leidyi]